MEIQALKKLNSLKLILFWNLFLAIILVLSACGDFVKESDTGACNNAIDSRNYDTALTVCTSRKDKASAYMGKAGYDIINLLKSSGTSTSTLTDPTGNLGDDDIAGASILNILQRGRAVIPDNDTRAEKISESRTYLDLASAELQKYLIESEITDGSPPLDTDEILLNTFAISFAMQLDQIMLFDNETTSKYTYPEGDNVTGLKCDNVTNVGAAASVLIKMDGHIWDAERNFMQCARIKGAYEGLADNVTAQTDAYTNFAAWRDNASKGALPEPFATSVCGPISSLTDYLSNLALNLIELKKEISVSGDKTIVIEEADNSTKALMAAVGCPKS